MIPNADRHPFVGARVICHGFCQALRRSWLCSPRCCSSSLGETARPGAWSGPSGARWSGNRGAPAATGMSSRPVPRRGSPRCPVARVVGRGCFRKRGIGTLTGCAWSRGWHRAGCSGLLERALLVGGSGDRRAAHSLTDEARGNGIRQSGRREPGRTGVKLSPMDTTGRQATSEIRSRSGVIRGPVRSGSRSGIVALPPTTSAVRGSATVNRTSSPHLCAAPHPRHSRMVPDSPPVTEFEVAGCLVADAISTTESEEA
jgi:hypothetical protein